MTKKLDKKTEDFLDLLDSVNEADAKLGLTIARRWRDLGITSWEKALQAQADARNETVEEFLEAAGAPREEAGK